MVLPQFNVHVTIYTTTASESYTITNNKNKPILMKCSAQMEHMTAYEGSKCNDG
jgi:hypothetical protein